MSSQTVNFLELFKEKKYSTIISIIENKLTENQRTAGLLNLKGHRSVGGMRASIYNAMPLEGVKDLIKFMDYFKSKNN